MLPACPTRPVCEQTVGFVRAPTFPLEISGKKGTEISGKKKGVTSVYVFVNGGLQGLHDK